MSNEIIHNFPAHRYPDWGALRVGDTVILLDGPQHIGHVHQSIMQWARRHNPLARFLVRPGPQPARLVSTGASDGRRRLACDWIIERRRDATPALHKRLNPYGPSRAALRRQGQRQPPTSWAALRVGESIDVDLPPAFIAERIEWMRRDRPRCDWQVEPLPNGGTRVTRTA